MTKKEMHGDVLDKLYETYLHENIDEEFIRDGPSHWDKYEASTPRIVFLAKEAHSSFHSSCPQTIDSRFTINIARWASVIFSILDSNYKVENAYTDNLQEAYDSIAIVEIKKIDDDKTSSQDGDLKRFAWLGQRFLQEQLEILSPHIIICLGSVDYYDIINNYSEEEKKLNEREIYSKDNYRCWLSNKTIVVQSYHPSYLSKSEEELFFSIKEIFLDKNVQSEYSQVLNFKNIL
jgi:hypothetical protein